MKKIWERILGELGKWFWDNWEISEKSGMIPPSLSTPLCPADTAPPGPPPAAPLPCSLPLMAPTSVTHPADSTLHPVQAFLSLQCNTSPPPSAPWRPPCLPAISCPSCCRNNCESGCQQHSLHKGWRLCSGHCNGGSASCDGPAALAAVGCCLWLPLEAVQRTGRLLIPPHTLFSPFSRPASCWIRLRLLEGCQLAESIQGTKPGYWAKE